MNDYYNELLDLNSTTNARITEIEKDLHIMHENFVTLSDQLKETQVFLVKLAKAQSEIAKRVSTWPFIAVPREDS